MSRFQFYVHKDTYNPGTATELTAELTSGVVRNVRYDAYDKDFKITIANNTMRIRDESNVNPLGARQYYTYFRDNTITYIDVYYNSNKIYTGWVLKDTVRRRWYEGTYWTEFTIAHVMTLLDTKYINYYTTELGAFEDLTKQIIQVLPATRLIYTLDTMTDNSGDPITPPYEDTGESFELTALEFAGEFTAGDIDELLIPDTGYIQIGRETTAYSSYTIEDSPYSEKKIIIFTISDRSSPAYGSREYWDIDTFMILGIDTSYIDLIDDYNVDLASDDTEKNFYWTSPLESTSTVIHYRIMQSDYDEAGGETTIPNTILHTYYNALAQEGFIFRWLNETTEDDLAYSTIVGTPWSYVVPLHGNYFSSVSHTNAYEFAYYIKLSLSMGDDVNIGIRKVYRPSVSDTSIGSYTRAIESPPRPTCDVIYTGDAGIPENPNIGGSFFPYVTWETSTSNIKDFQFLQKPDGGYHYVLIVYKNGSNYELRTYKLSADFGDVPTTSNVLGESTFEEWLADGTLIDTRVIGTSQPVLLRNVAGLERSDADGYNCRTRTYYLDGNIYEYQVATDLRYYVPSVDTDYLPTFTTGSESGFTVTASSTYSTHSAYKAADDSFSTSWINQDPASASFIPCSWMVQFPVAKPAYQYTLSCNSTRYPTAWTFEGSNNGIDWDVLDTQSGEVFSSSYAAVSYEISNETEYLYYRFNISACSSPGIGDNKCVEIYEIEIMVLAEAIQTFSDNEIALTYEASYPDIEPASAVGILNYFMLDDDRSFRRVVKVPSAEIDITDTTALEVLNVFRKLKLAIMWVDSSNVLQIKALSKIFADFDPETATELDTANIEWLEKEIYDYRNITIGDDSFIKTERVRIYYKLKIAELFSDYEEKFTIKYRTTDFLDILSPITFLDEGGARRYGVITGYNITNTENDIPAIEYSILAFSIVHLLPIEEVVDMSEVV